MRFLVGAHSGHHVAWASDEAALNGEVRAAIPVGQVMRQIYDSPSSQVRQFDTAAHFLHINTVHLHDPDFYCLLTTKD